MVATSQARSAHRFARKTPVPRNRVTAPKKEQTIQALRKKRRNTTVNSNELISASEIPELRKTLAIHGTDKENPQQARSKLGLG
jgi:hypothetical protein